MSYTITTGHGRNSWAPTTNKSLTPASDLDLMIRNGWGNTPRKQLPPDWRTRKNENGLRRWGRLPKAPRT